MMSGPVAKSDESFERQQLRPSFGTDTIHHICGSSKLPQVIDVAVLNFHLTDLYILWSHN